MLQKHQVQSEHWKQGIISVREEHFQMLCDCITQEFLSARKITLPPKTGHGHHPPQDKERLSTRSSWSPAGSLQGVKEIAQSLFGNYSEKFFLTRYCLVLVPLHTLTLLSMFSFFRYCLDAHILSLPYSLGTRGSFCPFLAKLPPLTAYSYGLSCLCSGVPDSLTEKPCWKSDT
jgi:hypothetical protein